MDSRFEILTELKEISSVVAALPANTPYQMPAAFYFETLASEILHQVRAPEQEEATVTWLPTAPQHPYTVPEGYFENFAGNMLGRVKAMEASTLQEETEALSPLLGGLNKKVPYSLPEEYFAELPGEIIAGVHAIDFVNHELETLSPVMAAAGKNNVYKVPDDYFNRLAPALLYKATHQPSGVVHAMFGKRIFRYATAALVAGVLATGAWVFLHNQSAGNTADMAAMKKVSNAEMVQYLENNPVAFSESGVASGDLQEEDIKELLADIPETELEQYINQYAISKNTVIN